MTTYLVTIESADGTLDADFMVDEATAVTAREAALLIAEAEYDLREYARPLRVVKVQIRG